MFFTLNDKMSSPSLDVEVQNIEIDDGHWHSFKYIVKFAEELELISLRDKNILDEKEIINFILTLNKQNKRIQAFNFFNDCGTSIWACVSDITTFKPDNFLKRTINLNFKKQEKELIIHDITDSEWSARDKKLPITWKFNEVLTKKYQKYKKLFL